MSQIEYRNSMALAEEIRRLRADYESRLKVLENHVGTQQAQIKQLQDLFAQQTVMRGSGPTA